VKSAISDLFFKSLYIILPSALVLLQDVPREGYMIAPHARAHARMHVCVCACVRVFICVCAFLNHVDN